MFIAIEPQNNPSSVGATWNPTCRPTGACWNSAVACSKQAAPAELTADRQPWRGGKFMFALVLLLIVFGRAAVAADQPPLTSEEILKKIKYPSVFDATVF